MDLRRSLTPAALSCEGIQYQYMSPNVFTNQEYGYIQGRLRILSGFYGLPRPFDGVTPYRLEMRVKLAMGEAKDLYAFWGDVIAQSLFAETARILRLMYARVSIMITTQICAASMCDHHLWSQNDHLLKNGGIMHPHPV